MKRLICALIGHSNITYLTIRPMTADVVIGAACLRCRDYSVSDRPIGRLASAEEVSPIPRDRPAR